MKNRLILGLLLIGALAPFLGTARVMATHPTSSRWSIHWVNKETIEVKDTKPGFEDQVFTFKLGGNRTGGFSSTNNFKKYPGCANEDRGLNLSLKADIYQNAVPPNPTPIVSGDYAPPGSKECDITNDLVDYLRSGKASVGFTTDPLQGPVTDTQSFQSNLSGEAEEKSCENAGALGWIMCPIINMLDGFFNFMDARVQALLSVDTDKYRDEDLKKTWSNVRNIAYIILIPVMLVMVIGTALGFSAIDAYTVKKALPRLVVAVIFIALSWEIAGFLIELSNNVGRGILGIMTSPLDIQGGTDGLTLQDLFSKSWGGAGIQLGTLALGITAAALTPGILGILGSFLATACLVLLMALLVLIARQLFILAIMVFLPIAIISWIFPGNDKLWKLLWDTFTKLLIMFPLVTALIGVGRVFAFIIGHADSAGAEGAVLNPLLKLIAYIIPYALIPYTFRAAGGLFSNLVGMANDKQKGLFDRLKKGRQPRYERVGRNVVQKRADWQNRLQRRASTTNPLGKFVYGGASRAVGGSNIMAKDSARRAFVKKEIYDQIENGRDDEVRGVSVDKEWALKNDKQGGDLWRIDTDEDGRSVRKFKTLGGSWVTEAAVDAGHRRWGRDTYAQQTALSYEMRKATTEPQLESLSKNYGHVAKEAWKMTDNEAGGAWIGAAFENQNQHLEFKYTNWKDGTMSPQKAKDFATEVYEKKGSYPLAQMSSHTIKRLSDAYDVANTAGDSETVDMLRGVAETFVSRYGGRAGLAAVENDQPVIEAPGGPRGQAAPTVQTHTPGAAHVAENVREFAIKTGVYQEPVHGVNDITPGIPDTSPSPPPEIRRQS